MKKLAVLLLSLVLIPLAHAEAQKQAIPAEGISSNSQKPSSPGASSMRNAYKLSGELVQEKLAAENKNNKRIIKDISAADLVVITGTYDHIHTVLASLKLPFVQLSQEQLLNAELKPHQTVFVNCARSFPPEGARKLADFVNQGGQLITTDWALKNVLEVGFPKTVAYNKKSTRDEVVRIEVMDSEDPVIKGFLNEETAPVWWLEGSSYPIKILDKKKVKTLIKSKELKDKYGEEAVLVRFKHGQGLVYHMISHFYLQRTETKDMKQGESAMNYLKSQGVPQSRMKKMEGSVKEYELNYGEVQSANTSSEFIMRAVIEQKKRNQKK